MFQSLSRVGDTAKLVVQCYVWPAVQLLCEGVGPGKNCYIPYSCRQTKIFVLLLEVIPQII